MPQRHKITYLPAILRAEISRRLHDGQTTREILKWLNGREEVAATLKVSLPKTPPTITAASLSAFRNGAEHLRLVSLRESHLAKL